MKDEIERTTPINREIAKKGNILHNNSSKTKRIADKTKKRPQIQPSVQLKLWVVASGRCEFHGCNENLYKDGLTLKESNYSNIAHIVSWQETGPRGDDPMPLDQRNNFENLMLACTKHHKLIDCKEHVKEYPKELLLQFKSWHEDRIAWSTSIIPGCKTTVIRLKTRIGDEIVKISDKDVDQAIFPNYPTDKRLEIDLSDMPGDGDNSYWNIMADGITNRIETLYKLGNGTNPIEHLSVFAIGPIPLLIHLGHCVGDKMPVQLHQRHRDTQDWRWKENGDPVKYKISKLSEAKDENEIALVLSLSGKIPIADLPEHIQNSVSIYEITLDGIDPNTGFLKSKSDLENFRNTYQKFLGTVKDIKKNIKNIHLFPAIPGPIAVLCGRELLHKSHPTILVYDYNKKNGGFNFTMEVNSHDR